MVFLCRYSGGLRVRHIQVACCSRTGHTTRLLACDGKHRCRRNLYTRRATQSSQRKTPSALFCALILLRHCFGSAPYPSRGLYAPGLTRALLKKAKARASPYAYAVRRRWRLLASISRVGGGALFYRRPTPWSSVVFHCVGTAAAYCSGLPSRGPRGQALIIDSAENP